MTQLSAPQPYTPQPYAPQPYAQFPGGPGYPPPVPPRKRTGLVVGSVAGAVVVLGGLGAGAFFLLGGGTLDDGKAEDQISAQVEEQTGVAPTSVDCPSGVDLAEGTTSTCTVTLQGQTYDYTLTQVDGDGTVQFDSDAVYVQVADVESTLVGAFADQEVDVEATCDAGDRTVLIAADGLSIPCTVVNVGDSTDTADVTALIDAEGTVSFE